MVAGHGYFPFNCNQKESHFANYIALDSRLLIKQWNERAHCDIPGNKTIKITSEPKHQTNPSCFKLR